MWGDECEEAFLNLKAISCERPILRIPNFCRSFKLAWDASQAAVGAVLLQKDDGGVYWPVAYFSRKRTSPQTRYSTVEKKLLALVLALTHFSYYASPARLLVLATDHKPLTCLSNFKHKNNRLLRWSLFLQNFQVSVKHVKGSDNVIADVLSRLT